MSMASHVKSALILLLTLLHVVTAASLKVRQESDSCPTANNLACTQLVWFGERAAFSPNGSAVAFMSKSYGDAFEIDLETRRIKLLTHFPSAGFLRVQYLPNGDYVLIGSRTFVDETTTRATTMELWVLQQNSTSGEPVALNQKVWEGVAISALQNRIAWATSYETNPDDFIPGQSAINVADVVYKNGTPSLANKREVLRDISPNCLLEPQDFRNNDAELTYTCYEPYNTTLTEGSVRGIDLTTGEITNYRDVPYEYNEVEGIFPDGKYTLVESGRDLPQPTIGRTIDLWRLRLDPNSTDFVRLTRFGDTPGNKAGNPVVSPDGKTVAFQSAKVADAAGVGYGIFLLELGDLAS